MAAYPQWWLDRSNARRETLARAVDRLRAAVPSLPKLDGVLIFGSYARGEIGPESDLDLIAVQQTTEPTLLRSMHLRRVLDDVLDVPYDLLVYTPEEFERLKLSWPFVKQANNEGIWLRAERKDSCKNIR